MITNVLFPRSSTSVCDYFRIVFFPHPLKWAVALLLHCLVGEEGGDATRGGCEEFFC